MQVPRRPKTSAKLARAKAGAPAADRRVTGNLPLWRSVSRHLEKDIVSGDLPAGSRLPSETALARQFRVNRHTLRRAIADLASKGLVRSVPQGGSFVAPLRITFRLDAGSRISDAIEQAGFTPRARLISELICTAPAEIAQHLDVAQRTKVIELKLLRLSNGTPIAFVTAWLPADRFAGIGRLFELTGSLRRAIVKAGVPTSRRNSTRIISRTGDAGECEQLGLEPGAILLTLQTTDVDADGEPVCVFLYRFSALRTEFVLEG